MRALASSLLGMGLLGAMTSVGCDISDLTRGTGGTSSSSSSSMGGGAGSGGAGGCEAPTPFAWARRLENSESQNTQETSSLRVSSDNAGGFFVSGITRGEFRFGEVVEGAKERLSLLIVHYDADGTVLGSRAHAIVPPDATPDTARVESMETLADGTLVIAGWLGNTSLKLTAVGAAELVVDNVDFANPGIAAFIATFAPDTLEAKAAKKLESEVKDSKSGPIHALATDGTEIFVGGSYRRNLALVDTDGSAGVRLSGLRHEENGRLEHGWLGVFDGNLGYLRGTSYDGSQDASVSVVALALSPSRLFALIDVDLPSPSTLQIGTINLPTSPTARIDKDVLALAVDRTPELPVAWGAVITSGSKFVLDRGLAAVFEPGQDRVWFAGFRSATGLQGTGGAISMFYPTVAQTPCQFPNSGGTTDGWVTLFSNAGPSCAAYALVDGPTDTVGKLKALAIAGDPDGDGPRTQEVWSGGELRIPSPSSLGDEIETQYASDVAINGLLATWDPTMNGPMDLVLSTRGALYGGMSSDVIIEDILPVTDPPGLVVVGSSPVGFLNLACDSTVDWDYFILRQPLLAL